MEIKFALPEHQDTIADFQIKMALETESLQLKPETVRSGVRAVFDDSAKGKYLVAVENNIAVATLLIVPEWSDWRNGTIFWIHSVYVVPSHRQQSIFSKMYRFLKDMMDKDSSIKGIRLYVDKSNSIAQKVYKSLGMINDHYDLFEDMA